ncbi:MAG: hypothetical protein ABJE79_11295 [Marinomonas sp.]
MQRDDDVEIPSLTLDQDEVSDRRPQMATPKKRPTPTPTQPKHAPNVVHKKANLMWVYFLFLLLLAASSGGGYWLWQQNQQLRSEVYGAKSEIENLDHQLLAADVSANEQGQTLEETLKEHDSEIRKLWAIAYDRNRKSIASNTQTVEKLENQLAELKENISTQSKRIAIQSDVLNDIEAGYNKLVPSVASLDGVVKGIATTQETQSKSIEEIGETVSSQSDHIDLIDDKVVEQGNVLSNIQQALDNLEKAISSVESKGVGLSDAELATVQQTLTNHQDAIDSSDAFRTQVNSEIIRLRKQINQLMLEQQLSAGE